MEVSRTGIEKKFYDMCSAVVSEHGLELYDLEYLNAQKLLRLFIMDPETKTAVIEDCVSIDRALTPYFDEEWIPEDIVLEVSSPGLYRKLRSLKHFQSSVGKRVSLKYRGELDLSDDLLKEKVLKNKSLIGMIVAVDTSSQVFKLQLEVPLKKRNVTIEINSEQLVKANWEPEL